MIEILFTLQKSLRFEIKVARNKIWERGLRKSRYQNSRYRFRKRHKTFFERHRCLPTLVTYLWCVERLRSNETLSLSDFGGIIACHVNNRLRFGFLHLWIRFVFLHLWLWFGFLHLWLRFRFLHCDLFRFVHPWLWFGFLHLWFGFGLAAARVL